jgi:hypothetical protein
MGKGAFVLGKMHTFVKENFDSSNLNDNISNETEI